MPSTPSLLSLDTITGVLSVRRLVYCDTIICTIPVMLFYIPHPLTAPWTLKKQYINRSKVTYILYSYFYRSVYFYIWRISFSSLLNFNQNFTYTIKFTCKLQSVECFLQRFGYLSQSLELYLQSLGCLSQMSWLFNAKF